MRNGLTGQVVVAAGLCIVLALLNIRGIQESARLNIFLAIADLATQALLVIVGVGADPGSAGARRQRPLRHHADGLGLPDLDPDRHGRLHRHRDDLEHGRGGARPGARRAAIDRPRGAAVFAIYAFLPAVALSAMPVHEHAGALAAAGHGGTHFTSLGAKYAGDPVAGHRPEPRPRAAHDARQLLRRPARRHDPDHRHERRPDRRLAPDVLDGRAPAVPRLPAHGASDLAHALGRDRRSTRSPRSA